PAVQRRPLRAGTCDDRSLGAQLAQRVTGCSYRVTDGWISGAARYAISERDIANVIHCDASHPSILAVRRICPLLIHKRCSAWVAQLVPAHADSTGSGDRVVDDERFVVTKISIRETIHQAIAERVQKL